jgi:rhomboid protease GluP
MANRSNAMLCPSCRKLISIDEPRCPYCGTLRPGMWGLGPRLQRWFGGRLELVPVIVAGCVSLYVIALLLDLRGMRTGGLFSFLSPSMESLWLLGMTGHVRVVELGHWWTLFTAIYLHGGVLHILFNALWIRQIGAFAEQELGPARFFVLFNLAGAGGFLASSLFGAPFTVGASGSIFGLLGAMIAYRRRRGAGGDMLSQQFLQWAVILFIFGFVMRGVDNWAHGGGFVTGYLLGMRLRGAHERPEGRGIQIAALFLAAVVVLALVFNAVHTWPEFIEAIRNRGL